MKSVRVEHDRLRVEAFQRTSHSMHHARSASLDAHFNSTMPTLVRHTAARGAGTLDLDVADDGALQEVSDGS